LSYNFLQFAIDGKNNSKTKVEKVFFFIVMSSYAEMSFLGTSQKNRVLWLYLLNGARYKDKKPHFEISLNYGFFEPQIDLFPQKKFFDPI
jgi:hypothetical protein